jgi:NADPH:quinone reductase-like Zn-dependent oxidoreductase
MKAIFLTKKGEASKAFEIRETKKPVCGADEVLIKVTCFGLNYAEVMARNGLYGDAPQMPSVLGYEVAGVIEDTGVNVDRSQVGKKVVAFTRFGGYAEYALTNKDAFVEIGEMEAGEACCVAVQFATAYFMACEQTNLFPGNKVLVHAGAGGVGTALIQLCKNKGCYVIGTAGSNDKLDYMKNLGADDAINYRQADYEAQITAKYGPGKLDVVFNPMGGKSFKKDLGLIGAGGRVILFGGSERSGKKLGLFSSLNFVFKMGLLLPIALMMKSKSLIGVNMLKIGDNKPEALERAMKNCMQLVRQGKLKPYVGARFKADEIGKAHALLESRNSVGKVVVYW